jgi:hypothetical protein
MAGDIPGAQELGGEAIALAEKFDDSSLLTTALGAVGYVQWFTEPDRAESTLTRALELTRQAGERQRIANVLTSLGTGGCEARRYAQADRWLRETVEWCTARDLDEQVDHVRAWTARSAFEQGRWSEAGATASAVMSGRDNDVATQIITLTVLGRLGVRRGDPNPQAAFDQAWQLATNTGNLRSLWPVAAGRAEAAWLDGYPERIPELVQETYRLAVQLSHPWAIGELAFWHWHADDVDAVPE